MPVKPMYYFRPFIRLITYNSICNELVGPPTDDGMYILLDESSLTKNSPTKIML